MQNIFVIHLGIFVIIFGAWSWIFWYLCLKTKKSLESD